MHDSFTPIGGLVPMWLMQLGEVVFGGVGSGLYGMLVFAIIAVFVAGLMIGRTPEYLGKKIEAFEMKMAGIAILIPPLLVLVGTALAVSLTAGKATIFNPGAHGFSEVLYAFFLGGQQQRQRLRGARRQQPFLQHGARDRHAPRALLTSGPGARDRRIARREEARTVGSRDPADAHAALRRAAHRYGAHGRRPQFHPGPGARSSGGASDDDCS
jgi:hypothetical protein